jgi:hypothetical protein
MTAEQPKRLHVTFDERDPAYSLYNEIIKSINAHVRAWLMTESLTDGEKYQAVCSALLALAAHNFRNNWHVPRDQFIQMAEEEYDLHEPDPDWDDRDQDQIQ